MALKGDRIELDDAIQWSVNQVAERGGIVSISTAGSGIARDSASMVAHYATNPSGAKPLGMLLVDVVNYDLTTRHANFYKHEVQLGQKAHIGRKGTWTTNVITSGASVTAGLTAWLGAQGQLAVNGSLGGQRVGQFDTIKDEDGFAQVSINLPNSFN
jgi:hypothetical protein